MSNAVIAPRFAPLTVGDVIARRWRVVRKLAMGAMGEVWEGRHIELDRKVAIKVLRGDADPNAEVERRFEREAFLLSRMSADHVARIVDFVRSARHGPILVMDLIEGPSLAQVLREHTLEVEEAIELAKDICVALRELHALGVVHRDVKPANIMLQERHDGRRVVFVDLGVSRLLDDPDHELAEITTQDRAVGTVEYMAPEQILSSREARPSADIYALGAVLYRAVSGAHVFGDLRGTALVRHKLVANAPRLITGRSDRVARDLERVVARALETLPEDRYATSDAMLADLARLQAKGAAPERRPSPWLRRALAAFVLLGAAASQEATLREHVQNIVTHK